MPKIRYGLKGSVGGTANAGTQTLNFHPAFIRNNFEHYVKQTVGHEVAHLVTRWVFGNEVASHGIQWASVMRVFNLPADRCHRYDLNDAPDIKKRIQRPVLQRVKGARIVSLGKNGTNLRITTFD
jgi:predicted SprT family Zn-dependent metalloprotease